MKAGALTPATRRGRSGRRCGRPLNEGGGSHPRNASWPTRRSRRRMPLNEGGGSHPRNAMWRRTSLRRRCTLNEGGGSHPRNATDGPSTATSSSSTLNEGGGSHPRNAVAGWDVDDDVGDRSMKAGALTPATPPPGSGASPGTTPLNEGGGSHPRNAALSTGVRRFRYRSMKAGALTPATLRIAGAAPAILSRSMKAGALTPATRSATRLVVVWSWIAQ